MQRENLIKTTKATSLEQLAKEQHCHMLKSFHFDGEGSKVSSNEFQEVVAHSESDVVLFQKRAKSAIQGTPQVTIISKTNTFVHILVQNPSSTLADWVALQPPLAQLKAIEEVVSCLSVLAWVYGAFHVSRGMMKVTSQGKPVSWIHQDFRVNRRENPIHTAANPESTFVRSIILALVQVIELPNPADLSTVKQLKDHLSGMRRLLMQKTALKDVSALKLNNVANPETDDSKQHFSTLEFTNKPISRFSCQTKLLNLRSAKPTQKPTQNIPKPNFDIPPASLGLNFKKRKASAAESPLLRNLVGVQNRKLSADYALLNRSQFVFPERRQDEAKQELTTDSGSKKPEQTCIQISVRSRGNSERERKQLICYLERLLANDGAQVRITSSQTMEIEVEELLAVSSEMEAEIEKELEEVLGDGESASRILERELAMVLN